jgi:hypothetical protein
MPANPSHIIAATAWVAGSFLAWLGACHAFGFLLFDYLGNDRGLKLSDGIVIAFNCTVVAGLVLIPTIVAVLALRAYLPGTGPRPSKKRGFPIDQTRPSGTK